MPTISARTIATIRRAAGGYLTDVCSIERETAIIDETGGATQRWDEVASAVPCRMLPTQGKDNSGLIGGAEAGRVWFKLAVAYDTTVQDGDRVRYQNVVYEIIQVEDALTQWVFKTLMVARLG